MLHVYVLHGYSITYLMPPLVSS